MRLQSFREQRRDTTAVRPGVATVELAVVLPLLCFLFVIAVDFARVFYFDLTVANCARSGAIYASHNYNPIGLAGMATSAFEIWEALGRAPDWVIAPVGHGSNLLSLARGEETSGMQR